jgi:hypothetical protein
MTTIVGNRSGLTSAPDLRLGNAGAGSDTLSEVAEMKRICDGLFIRAYNQRIRNRAAHERTKVQTKGNEGSRVKR